VFGWQPPQHHGFYGVALNAEVRLIVAMRYGDQRAIRGAGELVGALRLSARQARTAPVVTLEAAPRFDRSAFQPALQSRPVPEELCGNEGVSQTFVFETDRNQKEKSSQY
jgi:hypothetical protein